MHDDNDDDDDLLRLQRQIDELIDDQSKIETGVFRERTKIRAEHEKQLDLQYKYQRENILNSGNAHSGPGPGEYDSHKTTQIMKRPIGGLIQPLPNNLSTDKDCSTLSKSRTSNQRSRKYPKEFDSVDHHAVSRAQNLVRPRPVGIAGYKKSTDSVVEAAIGAQNSQKNGERSIQGPSALALLSRACVVNPKSDGAATRVDRAVFKSIKDGLIVQMSTSKGGTKNSVVLGEDGRAGTVSLGPRTVMSIKAVGSSVVFAFLGNRHVFCEIIQDSKLSESEQNNEGKLCARRPSVSGSGTRFVVEMYAPPLPEKPMYVLLKNMVTNNYICRLSEVDQLNNQSRKITQNSTEILKAIPLACNSNSRDDAEIFRVFNYTPESGDYNTNLSSNVTRPHTPGYEFGSPPPFLSEISPAPTSTPEVPKTPKTPNYRSKDKKQPVPKFFTSSSKTTFGRSGRSKNIPIGSNLEDDSLYKWLISGRMRRVILSTKSGYVLTAPAQEGAAVHGKDQWPGTGQAILSFCYIPEDGRYSNRNSSSTKKNSGDFALRNARGHYVVLRGDGTLGIQREPSVGTEIAINLVVYRHSIRLNVGENRQPLWFDEKNKIFRVARKNEIVNMKGCNANEMSDIFRVHTNVEGGASLGLNDKGVNHVKPRVVGVGRWGNGPPTPQTPDNMKVPSEGMPTPYNQRSIGDWMDEDYFSSEEDFGDLPSPEIELDRYVRPRVQGSTWAKPVQQQETGMKKRKLRSQQRGTPGPGTYDTVAAMDKLRKRGKLDSEHGNRMHDGGLVSFGRSSSVLSGSTTAPSGPNTSVLLRKQAQRVREAASCGPGMYNTSLANGSKSISAGSSTNSVNVKRGRFSRSKRFDTVKARRKVVPMKSTKLRISKSSNEGSHDAMDIDIDGENKVSNTERIGDRENKTLQTSAYGWHSTGNIKTTENNSNDDGDARNDRYSTHDSRCDSYDNEYDNVYNGYDEGKRQLYESKMDLSPEKSKQKTKKKNGKEKKVKTTINLLDLVHVDDILEQEGGASALLAPADLNINVIKPRVKGTTWGHKSVSKNFKNYHALKRARRRKQRESEIGPTDYDADNAFKVLVDARVTGGPNFAQEERSRNVSEKKVRKVRSKQIAIENQRLKNLIEKHPKLKDVGPNSILKNQLHENWSEKKTNKSVFQYREPEPLPSPAIRAQKAKEREKQGGTRWLSTQLPEHWGDNEVDDKKIYPTFDQQIGRESISVRRKGSKRVDRFDAPQQMGSDPLGPGHYEDAVRQQDAIDPLARVADRGVLSFGKRTGRHDAVGPFGERPKNAIELDTQSINGSNMEGQVLDIEVGDRPNRKSAVSFTWRKTGKWDQGDYNDDGGDLTEFGIDSQKEQQLVLSPHNDYLRPRNDRGIISFDKQIGRVNNTNVENEDNNSKDDYYKDQELQLEPRHTPVEKRKDVGSVFSTRPRFEKSDNRNENSNNKNELLLSPKEHFFRKKLSGGVSMDKQPSRGLISQNDAGGDDYESFNLPYRDADYDVERGLNKLHGNALKGGAHDFSKQNPRFEDTSNIQLLDDDVQLYLSPKEFDSRKKASKPSLNWSKGRARFSPEPGRNDHHYEDGSHLELVPTDEGTSNRSRMKKGFSGVSMSKSRPRWSTPPDHTGSEDAVDNEGANLLIDSRKAETSIRTRGKISPAGWQKAPGRNEMTNSNKVDTSNLVYSPDLDFGKKGVSASKIGSKKSGTGTTGWDTQKGRTPPRVIDHLTNAIEQLILSPSKGESALRGQGTIKKSQGIKMRVSAANKASSPGVDEGASIDGDRLKISPNDSTLRKSIVGGVSYGVKKTIRRESIKEKPLREPRNLISKIKTIQEVKRKKEKKMSASQKLQEIARKQYLQREVERDEAALDTLDGWE